MTVESIVRDVLAALDAVRLEAIWMVAPIAPARIELLVRDTPLHRKKVQQLASRLQCARVPLSDQVRTFQLVGAALPIDVVFGRAGAASYAHVRATATRVEVGGFTALVAGARGGGRSR